MNGQAKARILQVGGIPHPIGGVTNHIWRLAVKLAPYGCDVLDRFPSKNKYSIDGVSVAVAPFSGLLGILWLLWKLAVSKVEVVHFHFSILRGPYFIGRLLQRFSGNKRKVLTLHSGDLNPSFEALSPSGKKKIVEILNSFDCIIALSDEHRAFYEKIGVRQDRLSQATSFIVPPTNLSVDNMLEAKVEEIRSKHELMFVASGYPTEAYRHEHVVAVTKKVSENADACAVICLYGEAQSTEYLEQLLEIGKTCPNVYVFQDLDLAEFLYCLKRADLYLRPFIDDSCGLAVCEAITLGVPAIATDCCNRYPRTILYPTDDYQAFEKTTLETLENLSDVKEEISRSKGEDSFFDILYAYGLGEGALGREPLEPGELAGNI